MSVMVWYGSMISGFFFFKQKTAYEMRISDWSSDVCSSDLQVVAEADRIHRAVGRGQRHDHQEAAGGALDAHALLGHRTRQPRLDAADAVLHLDLRLADRRSRLAADGDGDAPRRVPGRPEGETPGDAGQHLQSARAPRRAKEGQSGSNPAVHA